MPHLRGGYVAKPPPPFPPEALPPLIRDLSQACSNLLLVQLQETLRRLYVTKTTVCHQENCMSPRRMYVTTTTVFQQNDCISPRRALLQRSPTSPVSGGPVRVWSGVEQAGKTGPQGTQSPVTRVPQGGAGRGGVGQIHCWRT